MKIAIKSILSVGIISFFIFKPNFVYGQYVRPTDEISYKQKNAFISVGSGMHYKYGMIGFGFGMLFNENMISEFNFGLGGYGFKTGATLVFNAGSNKKWRPTLGFSRVSESNGAQLDVEVVYNLNNYTTKAKVDLSSAYTLNSGFQRVFLFRNGNNLALDLGYAILLNTPTYGFTDNQIKIEGNLVPSAAVEFSDPQKMVFRILRPSGVTLGLSYNFGL